MGDAPIETPPDPAAQTSELWIDRAVDRLAWFTAILGGGALLAITAVTVVSITLRQFAWAGLQPIRGDFELVSAGTAFAVFCALPYAQVRRGHVTVDLFVAPAGPRANAALDAFWSLGLTIAAGVIAWRHWIGMLDKQRFGETTFLLQFPIWWSYAASFFGAAVFVVVCAWSVSRAVRETLTGRPIDAPVPAAHREGR